MVGGHRHNSSDISSSEEYDESIEVVERVADPTELTRFKRDYLNPEGLGSSRA